MSYHDRLLAKYIARLEETLKRWNPFTGDSPITVPREALPPPERSPYAPAGASFDARKFWGRPLAEGVPSEGDAYLWSEDAAAFVLGPAAGGGDESTGAAFRVYLTADVAMSTTPIILPFNLEGYDAGAAFDPVTHRWTPPAGPVAFMYRIVLTENNDVVVTIRKNGIDVYGRSAGRYSFGGFAWIESTFLDLANGSDDYELWASSVDGSVRAFDSFWAGMSGAGGGGGGGSSAPLTGDVTTIGSAATIAALHGIPITTAAPSDGESLVYLASLNKLVWRSVTIDIPEFAVTSGGDIVTSGGETVISTP